MNAWTVCLLVVNGIRDFTKSIWFTFILISLFSYLANITPATNPAHDIFVAWTFIILAWATFKMFVIVSDMVDGL